jgi:hypothetical protein
MMGKPEVPFMRFGLSLETQHGFVSRDVSPEVRIELSAVLGSEEVIGRDASSIERLPSDHDCAAEVLRDVGGLIG